MVNKGNHPQMALIQVSVFFFKFTQMCVCVCVWVGICVQYQCQPELLERVTLVFAVAKLKKKNKPDNAPAAQVLFAFVYGHRFRCLFPFSGLDGFSAPQLHHTRV